MTLPGNELQNDPTENPCFGCGPTNPIGLHLRFFDDGKVLRCELTPRPELVGLPGKWNAGIVMMAAIEVANWVAWERIGPFTDVGPVASEWLALASLADPIVLEGKVTNEGQKTCLEAVALQKDQIIVRARREVRAITPEEAREWLTLPGIPTSLRNDVEARASGK